MNVWHQTKDAPREPLRVSPGEIVTLRIGTWPIETGQSVSIRVETTSADGQCDSELVVAEWSENREQNSYWIARIGPFLEGTQIAYTVLARNSDGAVAPLRFHIRIGPKLYVALLWHHHQPLYKNPFHPTATGSYTQPWVRLHAIRDYYSMAHLVAAHPELHLAINLTPVLAWQIEDYVERGATDTALDLTIKPAELLSTSERERVLSSFFDADWHNQILCHERYAELFNMRREGADFGVRDVRDLQMWFNLAWFGKEFREGVVPLATGETATVRHFIEQGSGFTAADVDAMIDEQYKIMEAIIPLHRFLQDSGQVELTTTPFFHPILPLIADTDLATVDRAGTSLPRRFSYPEDAEAHVRLAFEWYEGVFGRRPVGMWPAEGAVALKALPYFERYGVEWIASDKGVLARSGEWGYDVDRADVLCQPYVPVGPGGPCMFFRDTGLSDAIGFHFAGFDDPESAARVLVASIKERFAYELRSDDDRVLTIVLDGENAWSAYREDARPFLHMLYRLLEHDSELRTVTFAEYLRGNRSRGVVPHPPENLTPLVALFTGSWIDEVGSHPGVDLGTWIGEANENRAWELLGETRRFLDERGATPASASSAFHAVYAAEGSDWFWWYGDDQSSGCDDVFDDLFRSHLKAVYAALGEAAPRALDEHIAPHVVSWTHSRPVESIGPRDRLTIRTHCPGRLEWSVDGKSVQAVDLAAEGGVMAAKSRYSQTLGPFGSEAKALEFTFECTHVGCSKMHSCCVPRTQVVYVRGRVGSGASGVTSERPSAAPK